MTIRGRRPTRSDIHRAARRAANIQRVQEPRTITLPSPVGGLNGRDAEDDMKPGDALQLDNIYPGFGKGEVRGGTALWGTVGSGSFTPATGAVETLVGVRLSGSTKLLAAADGNLYDVTSGGNQGTALATGKSNDRWQDSLMNDVLGLVNGEDAPLIYDGSTISTMTVAAKAGEPSLTVANLIGVKVHRNRSYFWQANDSHFWYSAVNALGGDLEQFPLGAVRGVTGALVAMVSWTRDGGQGGGIEDLAVFLMSSGQAVVFRGSDPGDANDWALVGVFSMGAPIGIRGIENIGGEAIVLTADGYTQLSRVLPGGRSARGVNVSDKLGKFALDQIKASGASFGWQAIHYPRGRRLIVNYPAGGNYEQHVVNLATGAWCRFRQMQARCWALFGDRLMFGTAAGEIVEAETGVNDRGAMILAEGQLAFSRFRGQVRNVQVQAVRPLLEGTGSIDAAISLYADYSPAPSATVQATLGAVGGGGSPWNSFKWNTTKWGAASKAAEGWFGHAARGYAISPAVKVEQKNDRIAWSGMGIAYTPTGMT